MSKEKWLDDSGNEINEEYIIINKTAIQKRIEELEEEYKSDPSHEFNSYGNKLIREIVILGQILSQSTPLIPEIKKAYTAGMEFIGEDKGSPNEYITNLKLNI